MIGICGSIIGFFIVYVIPFAIYIKITNTENGNNNNIKFSKIEKL